MENTCLPCSSIVGLYYAGIEDFLSFLVVDRIIASQRCPCSNLQNLWICYLTWQRGIKVADRVKVANQLTLNRGDYSGVAGEPHAITRVLKSGRARQESKWEQFHVRRTLPALVGLENGGRAATAKGYEQPIKAVKSMETGSP